MAPGPSAYGYSMNLDFRAGLREALLGLKEGLWEAKIYSIQIYNSLNPL